METLSTKPKVITVRKANYFVLVFPVGFLLLMFGSFLSAVVSTPGPVRQTQEASSSESPHPFEVIMYGLVELIVLGSVAQKFYRNKKSLVVDDVGAVAWVTALFFWRLGEDLQISILSLLALLLWVFIAILMIITLMHDEPFWGVSLYQNKRIIVRE